MKINRTYLHTFTFLLLYFFALYFWSLPYQDRKLPYGEFDALSHFEVADYMAYNDKSYMKLPDYIDIRYGTDNKFRPHTLWYPPTFHSSLAVVESVAGERVVPVFFMNTILATLVIITTYFVIYSLFGFLPAILSSLLLIFSPRDFLPYIWGQWPERFSYAFIPLVMYCFYQYYMSYKLEKQKPAYLYIMALLLGAQILVHPLGFFHSAFALIALYLLLLIKNRKIGFNLKAFSIAAGIFLLLFLLFPYQTLNVFPSLGFNIGDTPPETQAEPKSVDYSRIFKWSMDPKDYAGSVPNFYFLYREMHGAWTIPFLLAGLLFIVIRRENKDLFMLAWLISLYFVLHRDFIGMESFLHRSLSATAHIFAPITAIGAAYATSFIKMPQKISRIIKYTLCAAFVYFAFTVNMPYASRFVNEDTYNPMRQGGFLTSLSHDQFEAAEWILKNVPVQYNISVIGIPHQEGIITATAKKIRWSAAVSQHVSRFVLLYEGKEREENMIKNYVMFDYTMLGPLGMKDFFDEMQKIEQNTTSTHSLVYNKNNIRVYKPNGA